MNKNKIAELERTLVTINDGIQSSKDSYVKDVLQSEHDFLIFFTQKLRAQSILRSDARDQKQSLQKRLQERKIKNPRKELKENDNDADKVLALRQTKEKLEALKQPTESEQNLVFDKEYIDKIKEGIKILNEKVNLVKKTGKTQKQNYEAKIKELEAKNKLYKDYAKKEADLNENLRDRRAELIKARHKKELDKQKNENALFTGQIQDKGIEDDKEKSTLEKPLIWKKVTNIVTKFVTLGIIKPFQKEINSYDEYKLFKTQAKAWAKYVVRISEYEKYAKADIPCTDLTELVENLFLKKVYSESM